MSAETPPSISTIRRTQNVNARHSMYWVMAVARRSGLVDGSWDSASFWDFRARAVSAWWSYGQIIRSI
jgi:hypothetical protein